MATTKTISTIEKPTEKSTMDKPPEKTTLKRIEGPRNADNMIEGSEGPIIFPFAKIEDDFLRVHRNQLVHHNSEIAILVARRSSFNVSIKPRNDLKDTIPTPTSGGTGKDDDSLKDKLDKLSSQPPSPDPNADKVLESSDMDSKGEGEEREGEGADDKGALQARAGRSLSDEALDDEEALRQLKAKMARARKRAKQAKADEESSRSGEDEWESATDEDSRKSREGISPSDSHTSDDTVLKARKGHGSDEDDSGSPAVAMPGGGIHIPKSNVKNYFQWQFDNLVQQIEEEERCTQSDISVCNQPPEPDAMSPGEEALQFYKSAYQLGEEEWANKFLLLVGHCILPLMKTQAFLTLDLDEVLRILSSDYFGVAKERNVLRAAYAWLQYDPEARKPHTSELMGAVRFSLLTKKEQIKCLTHNAELLTILMSVPPFQRAFLKSCLWNYAKDTGLANQYKEFDDPPRITYKQICPPNRRMGKPSGAGYPSAVKPPSYTPSPMARDGQSPMASYGQSTMPGHGQSQMPGHGHGQSQMPGHGHGQSQMPGHGHGHGQGQSLMPRHGGMSPMAGHGGQSPMGGFGQGGPAASNAAEQGGICEKKGWKGGYHIAQHISATTAVHNHRIMVHDSKTKMPACSGK